MEEEREITDTGQPLNIYTARVTLRKNSGGKKQSEFKYAL